MPARSQELKIAVGYKKQTGTGLDTTTASQLQTKLASGYWNLNINAFNTPNPDFQTEDDADFYGKGHEWVEQIFPTSIDATWEWPSFLTSQNWAQVVGFTGKVTETNPSGSAYQYVGTPMDPESDGVNLPATTILAAIRQAGSAIHDLGLVGCVLAGWTLRIQKGPGLQNTQLTQRWVGCGKYEKPSGIVIPSRFAEKRLGAGASTALQINGVDYFPLARFVDLEFSYDNGLVNGHYPGSGQQDEFDIQGRMRYGKRSMSLAYTVELEADSQELDDLIAGTEGDTRITVTGAAIGGGQYHKADIHLPTTQQQKYQLVEADGFVAARMQTRIKNSSLGPAIFTAVTNQSGIGDE
jgi:hypothetical protein